MTITRGLGRFALEGALLAAMAALLLFLASSWIAIVAVMAGGLLIAVGVERYAAEREVVEAGEAESVDEQEPEHGGEQARPRRRLGRARTEQPAAPEPAPAATAVLPSTGGEDVDEPRGWNVWELDRLARDGAGVDAARDEERALLLMHLRGFAGPDGLLPASFDDLVREGFGDVLVVGSR